ncbi:unnamed protein product [Fusarium fujikuroi]|uniref:Uncharacterized protein n=1 Tax=Fusarium fujikuroi TaxID=5127 RepID=A0A9Q9RBJ5_FUSFU|nr:unnamed protein product [Fusarium fujikuroi]VTT81267.1 unnamed protein product [Fusarium fujikuroi]
MKLASLLTFTTIAIAGTDAWSFTVWTGKDQHGKKRHYHSSVGDNDCYNFDKAITSKGVGSFEFCSFIWTRCSVSIHSDIGCRGKKLGSATAADKGDLWPTKWSKNTSKEAKKMKSFRIQGCKDIPVTGGNLDIASFAIIPRMPLSLSVTTAVTALLLDEYSLIIPAVRQEWKMDGLPQVRPQVDNGTIVHIGTKWLFNFFRYYNAERLDTEIPAGSPIGRGLCDNNHIDGGDPSDRLGSIPYIGKYGYERGPGIEVYFAPLSWADIEPLIMGPYGENGNKALFDDHTPQFVSKVWIVRQGMTAPKGWIKVQEADDSDPAWRHQLLKT